MNPKIKNLLSELDMSPKDKAIALKRGERMTNEESKARWICCPMCDKDRCERQTDDCDVKAYLKDKTGRNEE